MKKLIYLLSFLIVVGCNMPNKNVTVKRESDSLKQIQKEDSIKRVDYKFAISKFKKWISPTNKYDTTFIHNYFIKDIKYSDVIIVFKNNKDKFSVGMGYALDSRFPKGKYIRYDIKRTEMTDLHFTQNQIDEYDPTTYFKLTFTDDKNSVTTNEFKEYHANQEKDKELIRTLSAHIKDNIFIEEYFAKEETGHFVGDKKPNDKKVRGFYLTEENKQAIADIYKLYTSLN
jgi:hypothetical protein